MIDNFDLIRPLLSFNSEDEFYFLQILQRKKDNKDGMKVNGSNNNSRLVKAYYIDSLDHYDFIKKEVIELCKIFNARAGINLNKRSFQLCAFHTLKKVTDQIMNKDWKSPRKAYNTVCGSYNHESDKRWILDYDQKLDEADLRIVEYHLRNCEPLGNKVIANIPSKSGFHLITKPFNVLTFRGKGHDVEIHKNNPTNLFIV